MNTIIYPALERGQANFGWLDSHHSFSFGNWYDPSKIHFGALRVLNDDIVAGGGGFGSHPHQNMEIISIPLKGALSHKDSMGTDGVIKTGDVQVMSAGKGISHSEFNASKTDPTNFLQIWIIPKTKDIKPRYDQKSFSPEDRLNSWQVLASGDKSEGGLWINQDARLSLATLQEGASLSYHSKFSASGVYVFVIEGQLAIDNKTLGKRDAIGIRQTDEFSLTAVKKSEVLAIEVPMLS
jgi:quercetin 2,3-dioxygenase